MKNQHQIHIKFAPQGLVLFIALLLAFILAVPAKAGNWGIINLDTLPTEIIAGEPLHLEFTVLQHGEMPVHTVYEDVPVTPYLSARHVETGEAVRIEAVPAKETGRFTLDVTFPRAGIWEWTIIPDPLIGETTFDPLTVSAAAIQPADQAAAQLVAQPAAAAIEQTTFSSLLITAGVRLMIAVAGIFLLLFALRSLKARAQETIPTPDSSIR